MKGKLIAIEGLDGSGKATQTSLLYQKLIDIGQKVKHISFPDYNSPSSTMAKLYLDGAFCDNPDDINAYAASTFFSIDRYISFIKNWENFYKNNYIIISDRYTTSNIIYQMAKMPKYEWNKFIDWLQDYEYKKLGLPAPNKVIYLDVPIKVSQTLLNTRYNGNEEQKDLHEKNLNFLTKCREVALFAAEKLDWNIIKCANEDKMKTVGEINELILSEILKFL